MPDTLNYMIFGYALGLGIFLLLVLSIWWRYRSLAADEAALETLEAEIREDQQHAKAESKPKEKAASAEAT